MVAALGAADRLVGISHECDHPEAVVNLPRVTTTPIDPSTDSAAIDAAVRRLVATGQAVIGIDAGLLDALAPDLIISQVLCEVCAVADGTVQRLATALDPVPTVLALQGTTLDGVFGDIERLAAAIGVAPRGGELVASLRARLAELRVQFQRDRPCTALVIEWLEPCFLAGHWTPEVIAAAGGRDIAMRPGEHSVPRDWRDVIRLDPEVVVIALCGFDEARARKELADLDRPDVQRWFAERRLVVIDGNAYTSRAGPRLVEAVEVLGGLLEGGRNDGMTEGGG